LLGTNALILKSNPRP